MKSNLSSNSLNFVYPAGANPQNYTRKGSSRSMAASNFRSDVPVFHNSQLEISIGHDFDPNKAFVVKPTPDSIESRFTVTNRGKN